MKFYRSNNDNVLAILSIIVILERILFRSMKEEDEVQERNIHIARTRRPVNSLFRELGPHYTQRAYRMQEDDLWHLCNLLRPKIHHDIIPPPSSSKKHRNGAKNGIIPASSRLSSALRYMAG